MAKTKTYRTNCRVCGCPVYYYPGEFDMGAIGNKNAEKSESSYTVTRKCTGENKENTKHEGTYTFPKDFT